MLHATMDLVVLVYGYPTAR